jgi:hypothetical protein
MVEYWKVGFSKDIILLFTLLSIQLIAETIKHYSIFPEPSVPLFQHSNIPIGAKPQGSGILV